MADDRSLAAFKDLIDRATEVSKTKSKAKRSANQQAQVQRRQEMSKMVLRAQRFLGLHAKPQTKTSAHNWPTCPYPPQQPPCQDPSSRTLSSLRLMPRPTRRFPKAITEVGVATLDTRDLAGKPPGEFGKDWHQHIRARHFRVIEHKGHCNHEFVQGCPEDFEFGESEFVGKDNLPSALAACCFASLSVCWQAIRQLNNRDQ